MTKLYHNDRGTVTSYDTDGHLIETVGQAKDYLELHGLEHLHWAKITIKAERRGRFTHREICQATQWDTCAVAKTGLHVDYNNIFDLLPLDYELYNLGYRFGIVVDLEPYLDVAIYIHRIQKRVIELNQLKNK
jgi:hypothetical protein